MSSLNHLFSFSGINLNLVTEGMAVQTYIKELADMVTTS